MYTSFIRPILEYASIFWEQHSRCLPSELEAVQNHAVRFIYFSYPHDTIVSVLKIVASSQKDASPAMAFTEVLLTM